MLATNFALMPCAWGSYEAIMFGTGWVVKCLRVDVGKKTLFHRHLYRSEHWLVVEGTAKIRQRANEPIGDVLIGDRILRTGDTADIGINHWHQIKNQGPDPLVIIELWMGERLSEDDMEITSFPQTGDTNHLVK